jgi:hypothetical protein
MPRQNRVTPVGELIATPERGTFMGNRGVLHDAEGRIKRAWQLRRWIACVLEFRGRKRTVMTPGRYTELFFLDEATALAAGHRPCAECRRQDYNAFRKAWWSSHRGTRGSSMPGADEMDRQLHAERVGPGRLKRLFMASLKEMPNGAFVQCPDWGDDAFLVWNDELLAWSGAGYQKRMNRPRNTRVAVLTPRSIVAVIHAGYAPQVHPSAGALG